MYFKIVENFGPSSGKKWKDYLEWRKADFVRFDSVDSSMRPDLFSPVSQDDWDHCVNEDYKINLITSYDYAIKKCELAGNSCLVGVEIELEEAPWEVSGLLGFDILDEYCGTSLLTNWGIEDPSFIDQHLASNGLIKTFEVALRLRNQLRDLYAGDSHAGFCTIWAVYSVIT